MRGPETYTDIRTNPILLSYQDGIIPPPHPNGQIRWQILRASQHDFPEMRQAIDTLPTALQGLLSRIDDETFFHGFGTGALALPLLQRRYKNPVFRQQILEVYFVHDVGKALHENVVTKPDRLTPIEFISMKQHTADGFALLKQVNASSSTWEIPLQSAYLHQEWYVGGGDGYPTNQPAKNMPLYVRIIAAIDKLEALIGTRIYRRDALTFDKVQNIFMSERSEQLDPEIVDYIFKNWGEIVEYNQPNINLNRDRLAFGITSSYSQAALIEPWPLPEPLKQVKIIQKFPQNGTIYIQ